MLHIHHQRLTKASITIRSAILEEEEEEERTGHVIVDT